MNQVEQLAEMMSGVRAGVAFTGAGMSTESGISDFRSPGGIWSRHQPVYYDEFVSSRAARVRSWKMRQEMWQEFGGAKPNTGHRALARFEELGRIRAVVTQNIDGLHQDGGSRNVIELHGTERRMGCLGCRKEWSPDQIKERLESGDEAPDCDECGAPIKSKTISFGQAMPEEEMSEATRLSLEADVFLAIGSSLVVEPAASLPRIAERAGARLIIINKSETPLDDVAHLVIRDSIGKTLEEALRLCESNDR